MAKALEGEARRRRTSVSVLTREAIAEHLDLSDGARRPLSVEAACPTRPVEPTRAWRKSGSPIAIVDTGPLYAAADRDDADHEVAVRALGRGDFELRIPAMVVAGATYHVRNVERAAGRHLHEHRHRAARDSRLHVLGTNPDDFLTTGDTCRFAIDPGGSCSVQVRFAPQAQGVRAGVMTAETNAAVDPQTTLSGTAGPLPSGPPGTPGSLGTPGTPGSPGRDAQVTCTVVKKKGGHRKGGKKIKVTCTVVLTAPATDNVTWRLASRGETVAHGTAAVSGGRARIGRRDFGQLGRGCYALRVDGRRAARFVVR